MSKTVRQIPLPSSAPGTSRAITVYGYGQPGARPKAYIQAGLHADELPGMLAAHHLLRRLDALDAAGAIRGEIVVVPAANPIGLSQSVLEYHVGRFALDGRGNFNRHYPDLAPIVAPRIAGQLTDDADRNIRLVRAALLAALAEQQPADETGALRKLLLGLSIDADFVLDLHCDNQAPVHVYLGTPLWPDAEDLARDLRAEVVLLAEDSGDNPFDEANSAPWWVLRKLLGDGHPLPPACLAATIELRGQADVDDGTAQADAEALLRFLQRRGVVAGDPGPLPEALCGATPLAGNEMLRSPVAGIIAYAQPLGARLRRGDHVADIVDPTADPARARTPLHAGVDGVLWSLCIHRLVRPGDIVAKIAGAEPIEGRGSNLLTS
ncbi:succinylglutamate desuccinylase/aspartoacylase family protein [Inquilinus limosus]|uniref:succinylglutamate desuccinylase/aspartoacylase family protein n=1 Tax=Inquilinus limosus TaxID=171674 RepID=UPI000409B869|nr:succinylglutamate desuccinylase/aspartoacylase family protein [Inquilinus limosus]